MKFTASRRAYSVSHNAVSAGFEHPPVLNALDAVDGCGAPRHRPLSSAHTVERYAAGSANEVEVGGYADGVTEGCAAKDDDARCAGAPNARAEVATPCGATSYAGMRVAAAVAAEAVIRDASAASELCAESKLESRVAAEAEAPDTIDAAVAAAAAAAARPAFVILALVAAVFWPAAVAAVGAAAPRPMPKTSSLTPSLLLVEAPPPAEADAAAAAAAAAAARARTAAAAAAPAATMPSAAILRALISYVENDPPDCDIIVEGRTGAAAAVWPAALAATEATAVSCSVKMLPPCCILSHRASTSRAGGAVGMPAPANASRAMNSHSIPS